MFAPDIHIGQESLIILGKVELEHLATLPPSLPEEVGRHLSPFFRADIQDLLAKGPESAWYMKATQADDLMVWGIHMPHDHAAFRLVGLMMLMADESAVTPPKQPWCQAETATVIWYEDQLGRGVTRRARPVRDQFAFAMGLDAIRSSVNAENERSRRAGKGGGYVPVGEYYDGVRNQQRIETFRYAPSLGDLAVQHAQALARTCGSDPEVVAEQVRQSLTSRLETSDATIAMRTLAAATQTQWLSFMRRLGFNESSLRD